MSVKLQSAIAEGELATLLIPVSGTQLVLPNVTVAEIITYKEPEAIDDMPNWYLGNFSWRNTSVPLVSFERINNEVVAEAGRNRRIAVLNSLVDGERLPFCGIETQGVPRLMRIMPNEVASAEGTAAGPAVLAQVLMSGELATIPDVDFIQQQLLGVIK